MALGRILRAPVSGTSSLISVIQRAAARSELNVAPTKSSMVRVSALHKLCPRKDVLRFLHNVSEPDDIDADLGLIFAIGTGLHYAMQNVVLSRSPVLEGMWRCTGCAYLYGAFRDIAAFKPEQIAFRVSHPGQCKLCKQESFIYEEYHFVDKDLMLSGHCDGLLNMPAISDRPVLLEVKSIGQGQTWKIKDTPLMDHVVQVHGYMLVSGLSHGIILYWVKGANGVAALKEFLVERDDTMIETLKAELKQRQEGLDKGIPPEERICATSDCTRAMDCVMRRTCFENHVPEPDSAAGLF